MIESALVEHNKLYGFSGNKTYKFVKLVFKNMGCMNKVKGLWYSYNRENQRRCVPFISQNTRLDIYEETSRRCCGISISTTYLRLAGCL
jgi:hypothetical protein